MDTDPRGTVISTILRHDAKTTSYKIALVRAINDVVLSYPDLNHTRPIAVPLSLLAEFWLAYYWPFVAADGPIWQGARNRRAKGIVQDMAFRAELTELRSAWEALWAMQSAASDGFVVVNEMRVARRRALYPATFVAAYRTAVCAIARTVQMPIRYAGPGSWSVFPRPANFDELRGSVTAVPLTDTTALCLVVSADLWRLIGQLSLWIEALCIHQWALFTENVDPTGGRPVDRGDVYRLLTDRPANRRPLTWERNQVDILLLEGRRFTCPWTGLRIAGMVPYDLDHLVPVALYPINEMWNLVPSDPVFNQRTKRDRLPGPERLVAAEPVLATTYSTYEEAPALKMALRDDTRQRFSTMGSGQAAPAAIARAAVLFVEHIATARNVARF